MERDDNNIPQWRITQNVGKQHHLRFSDKLKLKRFSSLVTVDHVEESWRIYPFVLAFISWARYQRRRKTNTPRRYLAGNKFKSDFFVVLLMR